MNMQKLLKQAQDMQEKMQREMGDIVESTSVGGDLVGVTINGHKQLLGVKIDPEVFPLDELAAASSPEEVRKLISEETEMLQDLLVAAVNQANNKMDESLRDKVGAIASGLPGLF